MKSIVLPYDVSFNRLRQWCIDNISKQEYYIVTSLGGQGWDISKRVNGLVLSIENEKLLTLALLSIQKRT